MISRFSRSRSSSPEWHLRVGLLDRLVGDLLQLVFLDDDCFDRQSRLELDLVERVKVGRVGDRDEQPLAALDQRQDAMLGEELVGDQLDGIDIGLNGFQVQQRHAEFLGRGDRDFARIGQAVGNEMGHQIGVGFLRRRHRLHHGLLFQQPVLDQPQRQTLQCNALRN